MKAEINIEEVKANSHWQSRINDEITRLSKGSLRTTLMAAFNSLLKSNDYGRNLERY